MGAGRTTMFPTPPEPVDKTAWPEVSWLRAEAGIVSVFVFVWPVTPVEAGMINLCPVLVLGATVLKV